MRLSIETPLSRMSHCCPTPLEGIQVRMSPAPLQKWLMRARRGSKNEVRLMIRDGRVRVNDTIVTRFAHPISPDDTVTIDDTVVPPPPTERVVWAMNKPKKHLTQIDDSPERPGLGRYLPPELPRLFPIGRLDYNSEGLLLWTDDGALARRILHPDTHLPKTYPLKIRGHLEPDDPRLERMRQGVDIGDPTPTRPAQVVLGERRTRATWIEVVLTEGRNRQLRRMCAKVGYQIVKLRRVAIGPIALGTLNPRVARALTEQERLALYRSVDLEAPGSDREE